MVGLLSALGGTLSGIGQGMVKQEEQRQKRGLEMREARRRELERKEDRAFQTAEREAGQGFQAGQAEQARTATATLQTERLTAEKEEARLGREATAAQNAANRQSQKDIAGMRQDTDMYAPLPYTDDEGYILRFNKRTGDVERTGQKAGNRPGAEKAGPTVAERYQAAHKRVTSTALGSMLQGAALNAAIAEELAREDSVLSQQAGALPATPPQIQAPGIAAGVEAAAGGSPPAGFPTAKRAADGHWYIPDTSRPGKYQRVD